MKLAKKKSRAESTSPSNGVAKGGSTGSPPFAVRSTLE